MEDNYQKLLTEMPKIAEVVKQLPESLQQKAFEQLVSELTGKPHNSPENEKKSSSAADSQLKTPKKTTSKTEELTGICTAKGEDFHFTVRDLKAKTKKDAAKRLIYVLIYSYMNSMDVDSVSRKKVINPHLSSWRLSNANTRSLISSDPGILKNGDNYSLDVHSEKEAKEFIQQIHDADLVGSWSPNSSKKTKRKSKN